MSWNLPCKLLGPEIGSNENFILDDDMVEGSDDVIEEDVMGDGDIDG